MQPTRFQRASATLILSALLLAAGSSCAATQADGAKSEPKSESGSGSADKAEEQAVKLAKAKQDVEDAQVSLQLAQMEATADTLSAGESLEDARRELEESRLDLKRFQDVEMPTEIADGQLGIERSMQSLGEARQELAQMEAMYSAEANLDATMVATRDMVLERHRKRVEFSTRSLELARARFQDEVGAKLPKQQRKLEAEVREAERGVRDAEQDLAKDAIESQRALGKAQRAITEAERKLAKLEAGAKVDDPADEDEDAE